MNLILFALFIRGFVKDKGTGEPLPYVDVYLKKMGKGTYTDDKGYFFIDGVERGRDTLIVSHIGYKEESLDINITEDMQIVVEMEVAPIKLPRVEVSAERERFKNEVEVSRTIITGKEVRLIPSFLESDLLRSLQALPGVIMFHDLSNKLYIRGGTPDENLMYLDGITVYNPTSHLFGLFSTFNSDAVRSVEVFTGGFPAMYGDRLSSVIDVKTRRGSTKKIKGDISTSLISTRLLFESPLFKNTSIFISYRRTYFDLITKIFSLFMREDITLPYYFYDFIARFNYIPSLDTETGITLYGSDDIIRFDEEYDNYRDVVDISWGNRGISFTGSKFFSPRFFGNFVLAYSKFHTDMRAYTGEKNSPDTVKIFQFITDLTFKPDFKYQFNEDITLLWGGDFKYLIFSEGYYTSEEWSEEEKGGDTTEMFLIPFYIEVKKRWGERFITRTGVRVVYSSTLSRIFPAPRLGIKYLLRDNLSLNFSTGRYHQFIYTINSQESFFSIYDIWKPVKQGKPPECYHLVAGTEYLEEGKGRLRFEVFYKYYTLLKIPSSTFFIFSLPSDTIKDGKGYSYGLEVYYKKNWKNWRGWISYTYCLTKRYLDGKWFFPAYDRRHTLNFALSRIFGRNSITLRWNFGTGLPSGGFVGKYKRYYYDMGEDRVDYYWEVIYGERDAIRLPPSHRLDIHFERNFTILKKNTYLFIDIINLYAHKNIVFYITYIDEDGNLKYHGVSFLPIPVISAGIRMEI